MIKSLLAYMCSALTAYAGLASTDEVARIVYLVLGAISCAVTLALNVWDLLAKIRLRGRGRGRDRSRVLQRQEGQGREGRWLRDAQAAVLVLIRWGVGSTPSFLSLTMRTYTHAGDVEILLTT